MEEAEAHLLRLLELAPPDGIVAVYVFGSTVWDSPNRERDLDIGFLLDRAVYPTRLDRSKFRVRLTGDIMAELGSNRIDVVILNDAPPGLGRAVIRTGRPIAIVDPEGHHAFVRDVQLRAADLDPFLERMRSIKLEALRP